MTLYDTAVIVARRWWIGVICVAAGIVIAGWIAFTSDYIYRAEVVLSLAESSGHGESRLPDQLGGLAALAGVSLRGATDRKTEAIATLQSRTLTDSFVREKNLLPILFARRWDSERNDWMAGAKVPTFWDANKLITNRVRKVLEDRKTGLVTLAVEWNDPKLSAEWATDLVERTNRLLQKSAYERANRNITFLKKQLEQTNVVEMREALNKLLESELKTAMLAQRSEDYAFKVLDQAVVPQERVRPRRILILALGIAAGIFAWVLCLVLSEIVASLLSEHRRSRSSSASR